MAFRRLHRPSVKAAILALLLSGCATAPQSVGIRFFCHNSVLFAITTIEDVEGGYSAKVGRCLGDLRIIGREPSTDM